MKVNMGGTDRIFRLALAGVLGYLLLNGTISGALGNTILAVALIFTLTSIFARCPLYTLAGLSTCKTK